MSLAASTKAIDVKPKKTNSVTMSHDDHKMMGNVGDKVHVMVHGKIEGVSDDKYGRHVRVKIHKMTPANDNDGDEAPKA